MNGAASWDSVYNPLTFHVARAGRHGGASGNLYVVITVKEHSQLVRDGIDLLTEIPLSISQAALGARVMIPTGWSMAIPRGFEGQVRPRSGLAAKHGVTVLNAPGTIDSDYRGEVKVILNSYQASSHNAPLSTTPISRTV